MKIAGWIVAALAGLVANPSSGQEAGFDAPRSGSRDEYVKNATLESGFEHIAAKVPEEFAGNGPHSLHQDEREELRERMLGIYAGERVRVVPEAVRSTRHSTLRPRATATTGGQSSRLSRESSARYGALACLVGLFVVAVLRRSTDWLTFPRR